MSDKKSNKKKLQKSIDALLNQIKAQITPKGATAPAAGSGIKVKLILPESKTRSAEIISLPDVNRLTLPFLLAGHDLETTGDYEGLYATDDSLNEQAVTYLFDTRNWSRAIPFADADASSVLNGNKFNGATSLNNMVAPIVSCLDNVIQNSNKEFRLQADDETRPHCDCPQPPADALQVHTHTTDFLLNHGRTSGTDKAVIDKNNAKVWVPNPLLENLGKVATLAANNPNDPIIYHEPHHELTPGMLLIDEIFRRMVMEVSNLVEAINNTANKDLQPLQNFVNGLAKDSDGAGPGEHFGPFLLKAGNHDCPCSLDEPTYHVDPSRIEVLIDTGGKITRATVIVGAWKGGTHSAGHTT